MTTDYSAPTLLTNEAQSLTVVALAHDLFINKILNKNKYLLIDHCID
jgi:hypothetical protein